MFIGTNIIIFKNNYYSLTPEQVVKPILSTCISMSFFVGIVLTPDDFLFS